MKLLVDGVRLEYETWIADGAEKRPIVLLHEGLGSVGQWKSFPTLLCENTGHSVFAYSRQGHGRSDRLRAPRGREFMHREAEVLDALLRTQGLRNPILIGHSDGGSIALLYASRYPTAGLVLMAPHVLVERMSLQGIRRARDLFRTTDFAARLGRYHDDAHHTFYAWSDIWLDPAFEDWNIEDEVSRVTAPILVIQGRDDEYGTHAQYDAIAGAAPHAHVLVLGQCGHSPHRERPGQVIGAIQGFLTDVEPGARAP